MEVVCRYTDPDSVKENRLDGYDISHYVQKYTWSGDESQAGRKLEFSIAFNTAAKEATFPMIDLKLGGSIQMSYIEDDSEKELDIFIGRIFFRKRASDSYSFEFTAYDDAVFLARNRVRVIIDTDVTTAFRQVCDKIKFPVADNLPQIPTHVTKVFDDSSCTEIFAELFKQALADPAVNKFYTCLCLDNKAVIVEKGQLVEGYVASSELNVFGAEHSESIEDMVNKIVCIDQAGNEYQVVTNEEDANTYGVFQGVYKAKPPKKDETVDNVKAAKAKLQRLKNESSLRGLGNVQCITGYSIQVQEEQLKGNFFIKADTHEFSGGLHTMNLTLEYLDSTLPDIKVIEYQPPFFKSAKKAKKKKASTKKRKKAAS